MLIRSNKREEPNKSGEEEKSQSHKIMRPYFFLTFTRTIGGALE